MRYLDENRIYDIPKSTYYLSVLRMPESSSEWVNDIIESIDAGTNHDMPHDECNISEYDASVIDNMDIERLTGILDTALALLKKDTRKPPKNKN
jgi:hypothetical protein